jgi:hypothetical protein
LTELKEDEGEDAEEEGFGGEALFLREFFGEFESE